MAGSPLRVRLDRPPPRLTDWMNRGSKSALHPRAAPAAFRHEVDLADLPLVSPGTWKVSKSGRYVAPELPCPYLESQPKVPRRRKVPHAAQGPTQHASGASNAGSSSGSSAAAKRRSRSVPPQAVARRRAAAAHNSPLAAACRAYATARLTAVHAHAGGPSASVSTGGVGHASASAAAGGGGTRHRSVLASILAADAERLEEAMAEQLLQLHDPQIFVDVWAQITSAAEVVGVDPETYAQLWALQHRDIEPEDYDVLQKLQATVRPPTLDVSQLRGFTTAYVGSRRQLIARPAQHGGSEGGALPAGAAHDGALDGAQCAVCLDEYAIGDVVRVLPCQHYFHQACIDSWLTESSTKCPVDNREVVRRSLDEAGAGAEGASGEGQAGAAGARPHSEGVQEGG